MPRLLLGGIDTGWTFYEPYSTFYATGYIILAVFGIFVAGFSSILTGLNFIVTIHKLRAPGMTWYRLPVFVWSTYATSLILVLATPVLAMTLLMLVAERRASRRHLLAASSAATRCCSSTCSGSTATRRSTS